MQFELNETQETRLNVWLEEQKVRIVAEQKEATDEPTQFMIDCWEQGIPYGGAIGGALTYSFTPTNLGVVVKVSDGFSNNSIDLTEYEDW